MEILVPQMLVLQEHVLILQTQRLVMMDYGVMELILALEEHVLLMQVVHALEELLVEIHAMKLLMFAVLLLGPVAQAIIFIAMELKNAI